MIEKQENRLQSISSERNNELRRLRKVIVCLRCSLIAGARIFSQRVDSLRHIKMEEAMKEAKLTEEIRQKKMVNHHLQADIEIYKKKQLLLKEETSALQRELEIEKNEYRIKDRELGAELSNVLRESTQDTTRSSEKEDNRFREVMKCSSSIYLCMKLNTWLGCKLFASTNITSKKNNEPVRITSCDSFPYTGS